MRLKRVVILILVIAFAFGGCSFKRTLHYTFENGEEGFVAGIDNVPVDYEKWGYNIIVTQAEIPNLHSGGLLLSGYNMGDEMFVYAYKNIGKEASLSAGKEYDITLSFDLATKMRKEGGDIFGKIPSQSVLVKAGLMNVEPTYEEHEGILKANFEIGYYNADSEFVKALGHIQREGSGDNSMYEYKSFTMQMTAVPDEKGNLYVLIGFHSYYIGPTWVFVDNIEIKY
jgi:hypothetical protein